MSFKVAFTEVDLGGGDKEDDLESRGFGGGETSTATSGLLVVLSSTSFFSTLTNTQQDDTKNYETTWDHWLATHPNVNLQLYVDFSVNTKTNHWFTF